MKKIDLAYLAGAMDSDGWFSIKRSTYAMRVRGDADNPIFFERCGIKQVQPDVVKMIHDNFGGYFRIDKPTAKNGKPLYAIQLTNKKAYEFTKAILPFLRIKKSQAEILVRLRKSIKEGKTDRSEKITQKSRWGKPMVTVRVKVSDDQIALRESLFKEIKSLNDSRSHSYFTPL